MSVINNFADLKASVGGAVSTSVEWELISYTQDACLLEVYIPILGNGVVALLEAAAFSNDKASHLYWLQRGMARLMMYEYAKVSIEMTGAGPKTSNSESSTTPYKYQEVAYRNQMQRTGYNFMESGMKIMAKNALAAYVVGNSVFKDYDRWIPYASDLTKSSGLTVSRYDYEKIISCMEDVSRLVISRIIPDAQRTIYVKSYIDGTISADVAKLMELVQRAVSHHGISEAVLRGWATIRDGNVVVKELTGDAASDTYRSPSGEMISLKTRTHDMWGSIYVQEVIDYILANEVLFPEAFALYNLNYPPVVVEDDCLCCTDPINSQSILSL